MWIEPTVNNWIKQILLFYTNMYVCVCDYICVNRKNLQEEISLESVIYSKHIWLRRVGDLFSPSSLCVKELCEFFYNPRTHVSHGQWSEDRTSLVDILELSKIYIIKLGLIFWGVNWNLFILKVKAIEFTGMHLQYKLYSESTIFTIYKRIV